MRIELEELITVEYIPYKTFKDKIKITKKNLGKAKIEIYENYVYLEKKRLVSLLIW